MEQKHLSPAEENRQLFRYVARRLLSVAEKGLCSGFMASLSNTMWNDALGDGAIRACAAAVMAYAVDKCVDMKNEYLDVDELLGSPKFFAAFPCAAFTAGLTTSNVITDAIGLGNGHLSNLVGAGLGWFGFIGVSTTLLAKVWVELNDGMVGMRQSALAQNTVLRPAYDPTRYRRPSNGL